MIESNWNERSPSGRHSLRSSGVCDGSPDVMPGCRTGTAIVGVECGSSSVGHVAYVPLPGFGHPVHLVRQAHARCHDEKFPGTRTTGLAGPSSSRPLLCRNRSLDCVLVETGLDFAQQGRRDYAQADATGHRCRGSTTATQAEPAARPGGRQIRGSGPARASAGRSPGPAGTSCAGRGRRAPPGAPRPPRGPRRPRRRCSPTAAGAPAATRSS